MKTSVFLKSVRDGRIWTAFRFFPLVIWPLLFLIASVVDLEMMAAGRARGIPTIITLLLIRDLSFALGLFLRSGQRFRFYGLPFLTFIVVMYVALPLFAAEVGLSPLVPYFDSKDSAKVAMRGPKIVVTLLETILALIFMVSQVRREIWHRSDDERKMESPSLAS